LTFRSGPTFFVRRAGESIYDLMAGLAGSRDGNTVQDLEASLRDADSLDIAEFLAEIEAAL